MGREDGSRPAYTLRRKQDTSKDRDLVQANVEAAMPDIVKKALEVNCRLRDVRYPLVPSSYERLYSALANPLLQFYYYVELGDDLPGVLLDFVEAIVQLAQHIANHGTALSLHDGVLLRLDYLDVPGIWKEKYPVLGKWERKLPSLPSEICSSYGTLDLYRSVANTIEALSISWTLRLELLWADLVLSWLKAEGSPPRLDLCEKYQAEDFIERADWIFQLAHYGASKLKVLEQTGFLRTTLLQYVLYSRDTIWRFDVPVDKTLLRKQYHTLRSLDMDFINSVLVEEYGVDLLDTVANGDSWVEDADPRSIRWYIDAKCNIWYIEGIERREERHLDTTKWIVMLQGHQRRLDKASPSEGHVRSAATYLALLFATFQEEVLENAMKELQDLVEQLMSRVAELLDGCFPQLWRYMPDDRIIPAGWNRGIESAASYSVKSLERTRDFMHHCHELLQDRVSASGKAQSDSHRELTERSIPENNPSFGDAAQGSHENQLNAAGRGDIQDQMDVDADCLLEAGHLPRMTDGWSGEVMFQMEDEDRPILNAGKSTEEHQDDSRDDDDHRSGSNNPSTEGSDDDGDVDDDDEDTALEEQSDSTHQTCPVLDDPRREFYLAYRTGRFDAFHLVKLKGPHRPKALPQWEPSMGNLGWHNFIPLPVKATEFCLVMAQMTGLCEIEWEDGYSIVMRKHILD
ncbi:hypothetical protein CALCODRAFT_508565 [Calocera cornea HHB12733]|uniref:Uncharacterized protein n=1 Tax=Calocera cornea HHB12733 TaxID=1353952 RepID=A0A165G7S7_9BASI|nr:hypothetical protein CALCODRAFT_508565 [Calocera cornea HHB12733]